MPAILVIDDDRATGRILQHIFVMHGIPCLIASTAEDGLLQIQAAKPTTIFVDLQLTGCLSGWEAIQRIKEDITLQETQVIAISAGDHRVSAMKVGCDLYLQKPFTVSQILSAINTPLQDNLAKGVSVP